ncbi:MAG TPA: serine--tRNA ligase, partial [Burkholderiaceae bacterium]|nr:serine--tRNA ligase [Burkholderiaceae bacterium]
MLDIALLRKDLDAVAARLADGERYTFDIASFRDAEAQRKQLQTRTEELQARRNALAKS